MNTFELNKIAAAVLFSVLFVMVLGFVADALYAPNRPEKPGYVVEVENGEPAAAESAASAEPVVQVSMADLLQNGDATRGQKVAKKCAACHTMGEGGANKIGPNLFGIVGRAMGAAAGFRYSSAMKTQALEGAKWSYDQLFGFLRAPKKFLKGTTMGFSGIKSDTQRADLVVFLKSISPQAPDLP